MLTSLQLYLFRTDVSEFRIKLSFRKKTSQVYISKNTFKLLNYNSNRHLMKWQLLSINS